MMNCWTHFSQKSRQLWIQDQLVAEIISDGNSKVTLSSASLLTMKSKVIMLPPRRRLWRRVQHLSKEFRSRWRKEFLLSLQERQKWSSTRRNFQQKDSVILKNDNCGENEWNIAKIIETFPDEKGFVRTVILLIGSLIEMGVWVIEHLHNQLIKLYYWLNLTRLNEVLSPTREPWSKKSRYIMIIVRGASCIWTWQPHLEPYWNIEHKVVFLLLEKLQEDNFVILLFFIGLFTISELNTVLSFNYGNHILLMTHSGGI